MKRLHKTHLPSTGNSSPKYAAPRVFIQNHRVDLIFLGVVVLLCIFGLLMVYDASQFEAFQEFKDKYYYIKQQIVWFGMGSLALAFFNFFDYHRLQKLATPFFLLSLLLLFLVFVPGLGVAAGGAHRWLRISALTIQPTEIIKLASIIFFALLFEKKVHSLPLMLILGLVVSVVGIFQKDLGSAIVFALIAFGVYFIAGAKVIYFLGFSFVGLLGFIGFILSSTYRRHRVLAFLDPFTDPQGFSYHISQVLIALGSGGFWGLGIGQSRQKFAYIPEVTTDSIFSVVGEELGFVGCLILISLMGFLILRAFKIAQLAPDSFGRLLASGLTIWLGAQIIVNLAAMVSLIPLTGVPLPFISYGGSALLANLVAVGILLNISRQSTV